ncbi:hypothetical protein ESZ47_00785 [Leuconostoc litchii]|uniref:Uncharacterized protein n=2 Tax=Leuconostoc litchii TaxID=1981069 RepID=A0A6P2CLE9_9LACO|nr:hypothetical protein ESZ47_00785 [Leuconostoc litchii]
MSLDTKLFIENNTQPVVAIKYADNHVDILLVANNSNKALSLSQLFARLRESSANTILFREDTSPIFGFHLNERYDIIFN